jgi:NitT/TauT family transport system substrate-binding protein
MRVLLAALSLLALLAGVGAAPAQTPQSLVLGWGYSPDVPQVAEAFDKELWKKHGLDAKMIPFATGRDAFEALIGGQLDLAVLTEFPPVSGALRNLKFRIVASLSSYDQLRLIAKSGEPLTSLKQLEGKKVGTPIGTNVHFAAAEALGKAGVKVEFVNVGPADIIPALTRGDIDAAAMFASAYFGARKALGAQYQEIMLPDVGQMFVLLASEKAAADPALVERALATLIEGEKLAAADPAAAQATTLRFVKNALQPDQLQALWAGYSFRVQLTDKLADLMAREGRWVRAMGYVKDGEPSPAFYKSFFLPEPLKRIAPERVSLN